MQITCFAADKINSNLIANIKPLTSHFNTPGKSRNKLFFKFNKGMCYLYRDITDWDTEGENWGCNECGFFGTIYDMEAYNNVSGTQKANRTQSRIEIRTPDHKPIEYLAVALMNRLKQ